MTIARKHTLYAVNLDGTLIGGITNMTLPTGTETAGEPTSGEVFNRWLSMTGQNPTANFTTLALATALANIGLTGLSIGSLTNGLDLYAYKHLEGGSRAGASSHRQYNFTEGLVVPQTLSVTHRGDASLIYNLVATYDGSNAPVTVTDGVSLPGGVTDAERFTLGPVTIGGISLTQLRSFDINFGITVEAEGGDSEIYDTFASIDQIQPTITLRGIDVEWLKAAKIPLSGKASTHANTTIYLRKRALAGAYVADGTAQHIKFTAAGLAYIDTAIDATKTAETALTMPLYYDGTNLPLVINTASAIT